MPDIVNLESDDEPVEDDNKSTGIPDATGESPFGAKKKVIQQQTFKLVVVQPRTDLDEVNEDPPRGLLGIIMIAVHPKHQFNFVQPVYKRDPDVLA